MFGTLFPSALFTTHMGQDGGRGMSPRLWSRVNGQSLAPDGFARGYGLCDDFVNWGSAVAGTVINHQGYGYYADTGDTIKQLATEVGGVIQLATDTTDNDEVWVTTGGNTGTICKISDTAGDDKLLIAEWRVRFPQVSDTYNAFIGLSEEGLAAADTVSDAGALADKDLIGFWVDEANGDSLDFVYNKAGAGGVTTLIAGVQALTADTWYKLGFVYDPSASSSERIAVYVDNEEQSTYVTATNIAAATFPDGEELAVLFGLKSGAGAIKKLDLDWFGVWQQA